MSATLKSLGIDQMSIPEQLSLLEELWDSIAADPEQVPVTDAQKADLQRRLDALRENPHAGSTWADVKARLLGGP